MKLIIISFLDICFYLTHLVSLCVGYFLTAEIECIDITTINEQFDELSREFGKILFILNNLWCTYSYIFKIQFIIRNFVIICNTKMKMEKIKSINILFRYIPGIRILSHGCIFLHKIIKFKVFVLCYTICTICTLLYRTCFFRTLTPNLNDSKQDFTRVFRDIVS